VRDAGNRFRDVFEGRRVMGGWGWLVAFVVVAGAVAAVSDGVMRGGRGPRRPRWWRRRR
jgi:hypothetical protein